MKKKIITFLLCGLSIWINAQQLPQYSQFAQNQALFNPSFIGLQEEKEIHVGGRWQMLGFGDEPRSAFGLYAQRIKNKVKETPNPSIPISKEIPETNKDEKQKFSHAFGTLVSLDKYGAFGTFQLNGLYAAHYNLTKQVKLSGGIKIGLANNSFDASRAIVANLTDPSLSYQGGDEAYDQFISGRTNSSRLTIGLGGAIYYSDFFIGASACNLIGDAVQFGNSTASFQTTPHLFLTSGYRYIINDELSLSAVLLLKKMQPAPLSTEVSVVANFGENLFGGIIYRHKSALGITGGFDINDKFRLGYSLDFAINKLRNVSNGGHELILRYRFSK
jgi:type IX secretion system PorP/SprF family membrane protein